MVSWFQSVFPAALMVALSSAVSTEFQMIGCNQENCKLPDCYCGGPNVPDNITVDKIPQMVIFTMNDPVNSENFDYYKILFDTKRTNPNNCPIVGTVFATHNNTNYCMLEQLYRWGHEIANSGVTRRQLADFWKEASPDEWRLEITEMTENLMKYAHIPRNEIKGWRTPLIQPGGDTQYDILLNTGYLYDATILTGEQSIGLPNFWPFTFDFRLSVCVTPPCPRDRHPGLWELPLLRLLDINGVACTFVDRCSYPPETKEETLDFLMKQFKWHYKTNRAPLILNFASFGKWFDDKDFALPAVEKFLDEILEHEDVYVVTAAQAIEWMKDPTTLEHIKEFEPWGCGLRSKVKCKIDAKAKKGAGSGFLGSLNLWAWQWAFLLIVLLVLIRKDRVSSED